MKASGALRLLALASAGIGAFFAAAGLAGRAQTDDAVVAPSTRAQRSPSAAASAASASVAKAQPPTALSPLASDAAQRRRGNALAADSGQPFSPTSWLPPPPPPPRPVVVVAAPPAPPVAPPLPFTFVGLVEKGTSRPQAFLARGDELLVVSLGDVLDSGTYRVDGLSASQIVFIHVPTNTKQIINLSGGAS